MLSRFIKNETPSPVDPLIDAIQDKMNETEVLSEEYSSLMSRLERLYKIKANERRAPVSRDTLAVIGGNLLLVLVIAAYEQKHVMTSKGFGQIIKPKIPGTTI